MEKISGDYVDQKKKIMEIMEIISWRNDYNVIVYICGV